MTDEELPPLSVAGAYAVVRKLVDRMPRRLSADPLAAAREVAELHNREPSELVGYARRRASLPAAPDGAPDGGSIFIDADGHEHRMWTRPDGRLTYTRDGADPLAAVREVAARHLPERPQLDALARQVREHATTTSVYGLGGTGHSRLRLSANVAEALRANVRLLGWTPSSIEGATFYGVPITVDRRLPPGTWRLQTGEDMP